MNSASDAATLYAISTRTGVATPVGVTGSTAFVTAGGTPVDLPDPATIGYGVDFNPVAVRLLVVAGGLNFRVNPASVGTTLTATNSDGSTRFTLNPYPGFTGGFTVARGDVTGDGVLDIITGAGPGGGPNVKIFDGVTGSSLQSYFAFDSGFIGGVNVAAGDLDGDGKAYIVTSSGTGTQGHVKVFSGADQSLLASFFAFEGTSVGARVAVTDTDADGINDLVAAAGPGGGPHVKVFDRMGLLKDSRFAGDATFRGGVFVS